jgi:hypothetical protein
MDMGSAVRLGFPHEHMSVSESGDQRLMGDGKHLMRG